MIMLDRAGIAPQLPWTIGSWPTTPAEDPNVPMTRPVIIRRSEPVILEVIARAGGSTLYTIKWTGLEPNEDGWSLPSDTRSEAFST